MKIQHLLSISLSLSLIACQVSAPLVSAPTANTALLQTQPSDQTSDQPVALNHGVSLHFAGNTEHLRLQLQLPGFRTQLAQPEQLAFVKVTLVGEGIATPITQDGDEYLPVNGDSLNVTLSNIPTDNGKLRLVRVEGFNASQEPLEAFEASAWYRSQTGVTTVNFTLNRARNLLYDLLYTLLTERVSALNGLDIPALQTLLLTEVLQYNAQTGEFGRDPALFDGAAMADLVTGGQALPTASALADNTVTTQTVQVNVTTTNGANLPNAVRFVLNDPLSKPLMLAEGSASGSMVSFAQVIPGNWLLSAYDTSGNLLQSAAVSVSDALVIVPLVVPGLREEFRVNTYTTGSQTNTAIAMDDDGDFVVTWTSYGQDGSNNGIYGQRYNAAGVAQGSEFRVNTYTMNNQINPAIAMDDDGDFVITWESSGQDGAYYGIYAQRYNASGVPQESEFRVNTYTTNNQRNPAIAMDANGDFVVTWHDDSQDGSSYGIYGQRYNASGVPQGSEFRVNTYTTNSQFNSAIAMDDDGDFVVTWRSSSQDGGNYGIYAQRYNASGVPQDAEFRVNTYTSSNQSNAAIAMDADGDFVITWQSNGQDSSYSVYGQRYNASGVPQGSEFRVNTYTTNAQRNAAIAMDADGDFVVTWESSQDGSKYGVYGQRYNAAGTPQGLEFGINTYTTNNQQNAAIAMDDDGDFVVTWQSFQDGDKYGIYGERYNGNGIIP